MDYFKPDLYSVNVFGKNGCAPPGALLAALWGDEPSPESSGFTCFRKRCVRSPEYCWKPRVGLRSLESPSVVGDHEYSLPHTVFSSPFSLGLVPESVKLQLDRTGTIQQFSLELDRQS